MQSKNLYQGDISICFNQGEHKLFNTLIDSVYPELANPTETTRVQINVNIDPTNLCMNIRISSYSLSQLRALINSTMYLTHLALSILNEIKAHAKDVE